MVTNIPGKQDASIFTEGD